LAALNYVSIGIFAVVYSLIVLRNLRWLRIPVWTIMMAGAVAVLILGPISLQDAYQAVNLDVILFLIGMFSLVGAMEISGLLEYLTIKMLALAKSPQRAFAIVLFGMSGLSAFLVNDTLALMATPIMLSLAKQMRIRPSALLITLAMGVTIGSALTPVGNPQNLLVALSSGIPNPLFDFLYYLLPVTLVSLLVAYMILRLYFRKDLANSSLEGLHAVPQEAIKDARLARLAAVAGVITVFGFFAVSIARFFNFQGNFNLGTVALVGATIVFLGSEKRRDIVKAVDWGIVIFFISLFIVMEAFWKSNALQELMVYLPPLNPGNSRGSVGPIIITSLLFSQLLSNVPFVAVYIRAMQAAGFAGSDSRPWIALAGASTFAGGLTLLGAASNVIILEEAEGRGEGFGFFEFAKVGLLVTIPITLILFLFLMIL
jgi:Na+/H+ antiporter NhaD/arsenite permease-like protein